MFENITRLEVIDETGRILVKYGIKIDTFLQDEGRTLKIILSERDSKKVKNIARI